MYRINCILSKPVIGSTRYASRTRNVSSNYGCMARNNNKMRHMSTSSAARKNRLYWGYSAITVGLFGTSIVLLSKYNEEFRKAIEDALPITQYVFNYLIPIESGMVLPPSEDVEEPSLLLPPPALIDQQGGEDVAADDEHLVVNIMDTPAASAIDFELGHTHDTAAGSGTVTDLLEEADHIVEEVIHDAEAEGIEEIVEGAVEAIVDIESPAVGAVLEVAETIAEVLAVEEVEAVISSVETEAAELVESILSTEEAPPLEAFVETPVVDATPKIVEVVDNPEQLITILSNAYENLRIILDDTITTKTSAAGMLNGYITQFGQALMISKDDPAFESIWEAANVLEHNVKEGVSLIKIKEAEANSQIDNMSKLIADARKLGIDELADKADTLIGTSGEILQWGESEIELANKKLNFLHDFHKRVAGSPTKLQEYLEDFKTDLIKLMNLEKFLEAQNLSSEDALLLLSLQRPELIYAEVQLKDVETKKQFEATMEQQKETLLKEADENLKNVIYVFEENKDNEMKSKVQELNDLHESHLQEELKAQSIADQLERESAIAAHEAALSAKHEEVMAKKLDEQEKEHYHAISNNLSSLQGIQSQISEVVGLSEQQRRSQNIWVAAQALTTALNDPSDDGRSRNLLPVISNVKEFAKDDDVLTTIIESVPKCAADLGVIPEDALVQRFNDVKRSCKRVAAVKDDSVLAYAFSYIKSLFVISWFYHRRITDDIDIESIGPYEILEKADYYMQQGDLVQAAKFMSLLKGVPRKIAADWINEVRLLLETKQAVNLLNAYAGSFISEGE